MTDTVDTSKEVVVERFSLQYNGGLSWDMSPSPDGEYVRYTDYAILQAERDRALAPRPDCPECSGSGMRDSGGVQPWGDHIDAPCDCENAPVPRQSVQKAADNLAKDLRSAGYFIPSSVIFEAVSQKKSVS